MIDPPICSNSVAQKDRIPLINRECCFDTYISPSVSDSVRYSQCYRLLVANALEGLKIVVRANLTRLLHVRCEWDINGPRA